jgi:hypothetical protein
MLRKIACAAAGLALACAAGLSISLVISSATATNLDLRWLHNPAKDPVKNPVKADRLPVAPKAKPDHNVVSFDLPAQSMSVVIRAPAQPRVESAIEQPRPVRVVPVQPVRQAPNEEATKEKLPVGCEPAFSPVTAPAYAHISVRCDS